ncbi:hypothetical protein JMJ77_0008872 [Colletotrichum scovillei]|uniref:Uncharacterized protein n=1 Tax=Colletotrichum scovillei TaxID=1209932 RepID=A0A9P7QRC7_9PEZI|nr:hypothetical protein JMJ78_0001730 [Colletotrichum scovillei]KAG7041168.1 hypothetical protein JMJ77_0008872 [Colletotrichum scovillei]KAG7061200.1 hypothetical protein JMJ76_0010269 [Colletotrichum scovillei]
MSLRQRNNFSDDNPLFPGLPHTLRLVCDSIALISLAHSVTTNKTINHTAPKQKTTEPR